jgi:hypothetical protein
VPPRQKKQLPPEAWVAILAGHVAITALTWRSIRRRPTESVRGPKWLWRLVSALNTSGSLGWYLVGRRRTPPSA